MPSGQRKSGEGPRGGRRKGIPNKATLARQAAVYATGVAPLDVMIDAMRFHYGRATEEMAKKGNRDANYIEAEFAKAHEKAKDAAPFVHPRLATLQTNMNLSGRLTLEALVMQSLPAPADNDDVAEMIDITPGEKDAAE